MLVNETRLNEHLNSLDCHDRNAVIDEVLADLNQLAAHHSLEITQLVEGYQQTAIQFVYRPSDNPTYEKYFVSAWRADLGELFSLVRETLEDDTMNIFSTNLFEFLSGDMIGDKSITLTIRDVEEETLTSSRGSDEKPVVTFAERKKKWVLNKTNARHLADRLGPETDNWRGHRVVLIAENTAAFGKTVKAIRIKNILPPVDPKSNGRAPVAKPAKATLPPLVAALADELRQLGEDRYGDQWVETVANICEEYGVSNFDQLDTDDLRALIADMKEPATQSALIDVEEMVAVGDPDA